MHSLLITTTFSKFIKNIVSIDTLGVPISILPIMYGLSVTYCQNMFVVKFLFWHYDIVEYVNRRPITLRRDLIFYY